MIKNFMINIKYEGRQVYANVFEYKDSPAIFHVNFVDDYVDSGKLILHEKDGMIIPDPAGKTNPELVKLVIEAIENNPNKV